MRKGTPDPPAGTIVRKDDGEPNGVVLEERRSSSSPATFPATRASSRRPGLVKMIQDFNAEGMTGAKDPGHRRAEVGALQRAAEGRQARRPRVRAVGRRPPAQIRRPRCRRRVNANPRPPQSLGDGRLLLGRREDVHGRQRRRPHRLDARGLEQEPQRRRQGQPRLSGDAARRVPARWRPTSTTPACT